MNSRYSRNRFYVKTDEQQTIKNFRILLGGAGIGSIIAECALRFGFETITNHMYSNRMEIVQYNSYDSRELGVTLRYKFNVVKSKYKGTGAGNAEKARL
jgi:tRNA A37 threonylcarbamoyladenosine dehydratase